MSEISTITEETILNTAKEIFIEKGKEGVRVQEIANKADINKMLLHFYFRSKRKLFEVVFLEAFERFLPKINSLVSADRSFLGIIEVFIQNYIDLILENPCIPACVLHELNQNPENHAQFMGNKLPTLPAQFDKSNLEISAGTIKPIDPKQLVINIIGLCFFSFVAWPIIQKIFFDGDEVAHQQFINERKVEVYNFVLNSIKA